MVHLQRVVRIIFPQTLTHLENRQENLLYSFVSGAKYKCGPCFIKKLKNAFSQIYSES